MKNDMRPQLRFPGFADAWVEKKLGEIILRGGSEGTPDTSKEDYYKGTIPFLNISDISNSYGHIYDTEKHITELALQNSSAWIVPKGVISLAMYASVGKAAILETDVATSQAFYNMIFENNSTRDVVFQILKKMEAKNGWYYFISRGTQPNLNAGKVKNLLIFLPTNIEEQHLIGTFFSSLDRLITLNKQKLSSMKEYKKSMLQRMFPKAGNLPELRFPGFSDEWVEKKLGDLGKIVTGSTPPTSNKKYYSDNGIPWVTPTDISSETISDTPRKLSDKGACVAHIVAANTILCTCIASIGKNTLLAVEGSFNQQINGLTPYENNNAYFLLTESNFWSNKMKQTSAAGMIQIVNKTEFSELITMIPSYEEQSLIGSFFSNLDRLITLQSKRLAQMELYKKALLLRMFC